MSSYRIDKIEFIIVAFFMFDGSCNQTALPVDSNDSTQGGRYSSRINELATHALDKENFSVQDGIVKLYGVRTNGPDTKHGDLACAKVVSIVLKKAGAIDRLYLGVGNVESQLKNWTKIENEADLMPGDVIVWVSKIVGRADSRCTGGGNCHIGIVTDKGYFHNSPLGVEPTFNGISLLGFSFKMGYRSPR